MDLDALLTALLEIEKRRFFDVSEMCVLLGRTQLLSVNR